MAISALYGKDLKGIRPFLFSGGFPFIPFIRHLELTFATERPPPSRFIEEVALMAGEESGEYE